MPSHLVQLVTHEHDLGNLGGRVDAAAHGHADVSGGQCGSVVNAVAHHGHGAALGL